MVPDLLNENQRRHLAVSLGLLLEDLDAVDQALTAGEWATGVREQIETARQGVTKLLDDLGLHLPATPDPGTDLAALTGVWLARLNDLKAKSLRAYGPVNPGLAPRLDSQLEGIRKSLAALLRGGPTQ